MVRSVELNGLIGKTVVASIPERSLWITNVEEKGEAEHGVRLSEIEQTVARGN